MNFLSEDEMNVQTLEFRMSKLFPYARELLSLAMDEVNINNTVLFMKLRNLEDALIYKESTFKKLMILMKESDDYEDKIIPRGRPSCSIKRELKMMKFEEDTIF